MGKTAAKSKEKLANYMTTKLERLSYGGYFFGQNIIFMIVLQFLMLFYTDVMGLGAAAIGLMFFIARTWDAINDNILGIIVDKCNPKKGKFKPWINAVIILMPLATIALFINPELGAKGNLIYAYASYILWGMIYTVSDVPIFALATVMTSNSEERVSLITIGRMAAMVAGIAGMIVFMPIVSAMGWTKAMIIMAVIAFLVMIPIKFFAVERIKHDRSAGLTLKDIFNLIRINKPLIAFYSAFLIAGAFNTIMVVQPYFAKYLLGNETLIGVLGVSSFLPLLVIIPFLPKLIRKFGKKNIYVYGTLISVIANIAFYFIGYSSLPVVMILGAVRSLGSFVPMMMMGMFSADFVEYGHFKTGKRAEGISFSMQTFATKFSQAIGAVLSGILLENVYGYVANAEQTEQATKGIFALYTWIPAVGLIIALLIVAKFYHLDEKQVETMIEKNNSKVA